MPAGGATSEREVVPDDGAAVRPEAGFSFRAGGWIGNTVLGDVDEVFRCRCCGRVLTATLGAAGARSLVGVPTALGVRVAVSEDGRVSGPEFSGVLAGG